MEPSKPVIVLSRVEEPQFSMLQSIPHVISSGADSFANLPNDVDVVLVWSVTRELLQPALQRLPQVKWIHSRYAGLDELLFPELVGHKAILTNGRGTFSQSLGEFVIAAILYFAKDFPRMLRNQAAGRWEQFDVEEISKQTLGIVAYGDIGRAIARRAQAMGMRVLAHKRHVTQSSDSVIDHYFKPEELHEMLAQCDYVAVAAPLTSETHHMISDREFATMKSSAVVINVGRGPVIDEAALIRALREKRIRGAGLDVFEKEPLPDNHPFYGMENVLLSPHTADHTADWKDDAMKFFLEQYERFLKGEPLKNIVNKRLGY
jgi:phosphoglycerate dehydrogenase-like enzyme